MPEKPKVEALTKTYINRINLSRALISFHESREMSCSFTKEYIMSKIALITGITGQDGSYLAELLLEKGYEVHGIIRRTSTEAGKWRIAHLIEKKAIHLHYGDVSDSLSVYRIVAELQPDEIYNLAAQSHVRDSFDMPQYTLSVDGGGALNVLEAVRLAGLAKKTRVYQASTSEIFGEAPAPQSETTPFWPRSPYGCAKVYAHYLSRNYREAYGMFVCSGFLFNHESERRGELFVTRTITRHAARIALGIDDPIPFSNPSSRRDWGHAKDFVVAMWLMLQQESPDDFVIATGEQHSNREFTERVFGLLGIHVEWHGEGTDEVCIRADTGEIVGYIEPTLYRPTDVTNLHGDATKARTKLGWKPQVTFDELVREMTVADFERAKKGII